MSALLRAAAGGTALALLLGACSTAGAQTADTTGDGGGAAAAGFGPDGPAPEDRPDPALAGQPVPTLPPGDPGVGDSEDDGDPAEAPDGHSPDEGDHESGAHEDGDDPDGGTGRTEVPLAAFVDPGSAAAVAGGSWAASATAGDCTTAAPSGATAARSIALDSAEGRLVETVGSYAGVATARAAVPGAAEALAACGFTVTGDPRLGDASVELRGDTSPGARRALVVSAEGALVVLVASGSAAAAGAWESLADIALGSSCDAGPHGCH